MSLGARWKAAVAAFRGKSANNSANDILLNMLGVSRGNKDEAAVNEAVYFACLKVLSESIGKLPLKVQQYTPEHGIRVAREHPYYRMLNERPNRFMTASTFWGLMELCRSHYGNAYAWIDTHDPTKPQLWPIDPEKVEVWYDDARLLKDVPDLFYKISTPKGQIVLGSEEVLHFKSHYTEDGLVGIPVRKQLATTITGSVKAQKYLNKLYENGMTAKAVLQYTGGLDDSKVAALVKGIETYARGEMKSKGVENIIPIPLGMQLTPMNFKLTDSQFLEIKQYTALQIASAFGVKPYQVGDYTKSSYASAEAQQLSFLVDTLLFIVKGLEEEIAYKLLTDEEEAAGFHVKFNTAVILRADQKTQIETLKSAVSCFLMTPNEAREKIDLPAKEGGDQLIGNGSTIPITEVGKQWADKKDEPEQEESDRDQQAEQPDDHNDSAEEGGKEE